MRPIAQSLIKKRKLIYEWKVINPFASRNYIIVIVIVRHLLLMLLFVVMVTVTITVDAIDS